MKGILLVNLGSPKNPTEEDLRHYLDEFLMDKYVMDIPYLQRLLLVKGIILRRRPKETAKAYRKIWTKEGSPLIVISEKFKSKFQNLVNVPVSLGMRYGEPSLKTGIEELVNQGVTEILMIPLYPQFAMSATETVTILAEKIRKKYFKDVSIEHVPAFYNKMDYIKVLARSIKESLDKSDFDHLLFSYHGLPKRHIIKSDLTNSHTHADLGCCDDKPQAHKYCYRHQCYETTRLVAKELGLKPEFYSVSFQSRLGKTPWIEPFTDVTIDKMAKKESINNLAVVIPTFVADCLETLEEIAMVAKKSFQDNGGENLTAIPCLNERDDWVEVVVNWSKNWINK